MREGGDETAAEEALEFAEPVSDNRILGLPLLNVVELEETPPSYK